MFLWRDNLDSLRHSVGYGSRLLITTSAALLSVTATAAGQTVPTAPLTLGGAIERALEANPGIAAARLRGDITLAQLRVARERLNPEARVEIERETPTEAYSLAVPWEAGGKRERRIAVAEAAIRTGEAEVAQTIAEVRFSVRRAYFGRLVAEARLSLLEEMQMLAMRARDVAQQRFETGDAPRLEVMQAQLAVAQAENEATAARGTVTAARAELNALLGLPLGGSIPLAESLDAGEVAVASVVIARAEAANTELGVINRRLEEQRARLALARSLQVPDVTPEFTVTRGNDPEFNTGWRAAVAVTLPLFASHRAGVLVEEATLTQLMRQREATLARITGEVTAASAIADAQRVQYGRYRDEILPQALEVERLAEESYRLGQTGIVALLQALQASRDARLRSLQAAESFQTALAELERSVGAPVP
jgi:cobalt-zinc-cadmium efflux system outer membrane protein